MFGLKKKTPQKTVSKKEKARAGEWHRIHDKRTSGHKSLITKVKKNGLIEHIPTTHAPKTRNQRNIKLKENPQKGKTEDSYIIPKVQKTTSKYVGKKQTDMEIKNTTDKSVIRHIKNKSKKKTKK